MEKTRVIILGAAGREFHNFNVYYRNNPKYEVIAFTATQIPGIAGRKYPKELAGKYYKDGIPIHPEEQLSELIKKFNIDEVVFAYSDVSHEEVMHKASIALSHGVNFVLLGPNHTMIKSRKPVVAICATRTGAGKSPTTRKVTKILREMGKKVIVIRHPMPYGNLKKQMVQRFKTYKDLDKFETTIEEREEYEGHITNGFVVYAGVDYEKILRKAEKEADIIVWDGGNNDFSFIKPDLLIVVADARRAGHEIRYHPGESNVRMADVIIINKVNSAKPEDVKIIEKNIAELNPKAKIVHANLTIEPEEPEMIKDKRILAIEDGPTLTHGEMSTGAAYIAAVKYGAKEIIDPRKFAVGSIVDVFKKFKQLTSVLPAMGYGKEQMKELEDTINKSDCDLVLIGTPIDLKRLLEINKPAMRVRYELEEVGKPDLEDVLKSI